jgi:hypothetical protein
MKDLNSFLEADAVRSHGLQGRGRKTAQQPALNPKGRLDIAAYRVVSEHLLPFCEGILGVPGLAQVLRPHAEALIAEKIPAVNVLAPKPRRRLTP